MLVFGNTFSKFYGKSEWVSRLSEHSVWAFWLNSVSEHSEWVVWVSIFWVSILLLYLLQFEFQSLLVSPGRLYSKEIQFITDRVSCIQEVTTSPDSRAITNGITNIIKNCITSVTSTAITVLQSVASAITSTAKMFCYDYCIFNWCSCHSVGLLFLL